MLEPVAFYWYSTGKSQAPANRMSSAKNLGFVTTCNFGGHAESHDSPDSQRFRCTEGRDWRVKEREQLSHEAMPHVDET